jgi:hypothetical protein
VVSKNQVDLDGWVDGWVDGWTDGRKRRNESSARWYHVALCRAEVVCSGRMRIMELESEKRSES